MSLGIATKELPHTMAPSIDEELGDFYIFPALLFGFKTAPLLWSRTAALLARLLQSAVPGEEGMHQVYLDDALWILQGSLRDRNSNLAFILSTATVLGFRISLLKGERSTQVQWIGVRITLLDDAVIMGIPERYVRELLEMLRSWDGRGMAPVRELHRVAGKVSWMSGLLPRTRWIVAVFYRVLHLRLKDVADGTEASRRGQRTDARNKDHLFPVKQLEQARLWMVKYLEVAMEKPSRKFKLNIKQYPQAKIITDASPEGLGAVLLVNNKIIRAFSSKVTALDAATLNFALGESSSQGTLETLAVIVAVKHWSKELASCQVVLEVQSDSVVALALTQRLGHSTPAINFLGGELAVQCEQTGLESVKATHIPGTANTIADYLSRPSKWSTHARPQELEGITIGTPAKREGDYYHLPTPQAAPELWAASGAAESAWASLRK
eukprot:Skav219239  [mRNA]  locus=scaffold1242:54882:56198:- [translate_table: standard]